LSFSPVFLSAVCAFAESKRVKAARLSRIFIGSGFSDGNKIKVRKERGIKK
jgi:hypothetical protein